ncbi:phosphoglycerate kinase [Nanoarchaeota archaeon]
MGTPTLKEVYLAKKKILVRTGFDVPIDKSGKILDDRRIKLSIPTINYLLEHGAEQIIIATHAGRPDPKDPDPNLKTDKIAELLSQLLDQPIKKVDDHGEKPIPKPEDSKIVMLENLRFDTREKSKDPTKREEFGKQLASLADIYVNDSFSTCHRDHTSMTSIPKFIPGCIGLSVEQEITTITTALKDPKRPFISIIGGLKADKLNAIRHLLSRVDRILVAGALAFTILKQFGKEVGATKTDTEGLAGFESLIAEIKNNPKVILPTDCLVSNEFSDSALAVKTSIDTIKPGWMALDIGPESTKHYTDILQDAKTIIWNGPIGVFEFANFAEGTKAIANTLAESEATTIVGGGDSASAVDTLGLSEKMTLVSSGGGASLTLFEGKPLVAIKALDNQSKNSQSQKNSDGE